MIAKTPPDPAKTWPLALTLIIAAFCLQAGFQTTRLIGDHLTLQRIATSQTQALHQSLTTRNQLGFLAGSIARLAADGNADATAVVDVMRHQGIALKPPVPTGSR